jgi:Subtilase family
VKWFPIYALILLTVFSAGSPEARIIDLEAYRFETSVGEPALPADLRIDEQTDQLFGYYLVQHRGPVSESWRTTLSRHGAEIYGYVGEFAYLVGMNQSARSLVETLDQVAWVGDYHPAYKISPRIGQQVFVTPERIENPNYRLSVRLFKNADEVAGQLIGLGCEVLDRTDDGFSLRLLVSAPKDRLNSIARIADVWWVEEQAEFTTLNNTARWVAQSNVNGSTPLWDNGLHGEGQLATIMDSGVDYNSCWFRDPSGASPNINHRKVTNYATFGGVAYDGCDVGHGTHVAGTMAGDQSVINPGNYNYNGMAYASKFTVQDVGVDDWSGCSLGSVSVPSSLTSAFTTSYNLGARLHQNSWGSSTNAYDGFCVDIDNMMWNNKDYLICFAAGNAGPGGSTVGSPGTAKSCLTVGSCRNAPQQEILASYSSRGPASDNRYKPTVTAPGGEDPNFITSANNDIGNPPAFTCLTASSPFQGTSMATPCVSGMAMNIRQYFVDGYYPLGSTGGDEPFAPKAALIKATMIACTEDMSAGDIPNNNEGWGRVLLDNSLFFDGDTRELIAMDVEPGLGTDERWIDAVTVDSGSERLVITLVWTDYPGTSGSGSAIVNDLDLIVTAPGGAVYLGNRFSGGQSTTGGSPDRLNVEECVRLNSPATGDWMVEVTGYNVPHGPQPFAIVFNGSFDGWPEDLTDATFEDEPAISSLDISAYPNPATTNTTIRYALPSDYTGAVELTVVDVSGRIVRQLVDKGQHGGDYFVTWNGLDTYQRQVPEGVYFARISTGAAEATTRIVIQR